MLSQKVSEISSSERKNHRRLNCRNGCRSRFSGQQRHLSNCRSFRKLRDKEVDAGSRIFFPNFDEAGLDDIHRHAGRTFAYDDFSRWELCRLETGDQLGEAVGAKFREKLDVLEELSELFGVVNYRRHVWFKLGNFSPLRAS